MVAQAPTPTPSPPPPEDDLPIDIDHAKFLTWLIDRRRIPPDWHLHLKTARTLTLHALSQTAPAALLALSLPATPTPLPYHRALATLTALTAPTAPAAWRAGPATDLLARYKAPAPRAWAAAVAAFERHNVFLADAAQLLVRNVAVHARAIRARIAALHLQVADYARREAPARTAAQQARARFETACAQFDLPVQGSHDFHALLARAVERAVPQLLAAAVACAKDPDFVRAVAYYEDFARYVAQQQQHQSAGGPAALCPNVARVVDGDVDVLSRPVRKRPSEGEELHPAAADDAVDWGIPALDIGVAPDGDTAQAAGDADVDADIDWGIEIDTSHSGHAVVGDLGAGSSLQGGGGGGDGGGIDWNDTGEGVVTELEVATEVTAPQLVAEGEEIFTLADPKSRELYLNDLIELDAFLAQRAVELSRSGDSEIGLVMQQSSSTPDFVSSVDKDRVRILQDKVGAAISAINSAETRQMLALQSDPKRVERAARAVLEKKHVAERMHAAIDVLRKRRARAVEELALENPKFEELARDTRDVKRRTEIALSKLYKGRTVNILGEINNVFPPVD